MANLKANAPGAKVTHLSGVLPSPYGTNIVQVLFNRAVHVLFNRAPDPDSARKALDAWQAKNVQVQGEVPTSKLVQRNIRIETPNRFITLEQAIKERRIITTVKPFRPNAALIESFLPARNVVRFYKPTCVRESLREALIGIPVTTTYVVRDLLKLPAKSPQALILTALTVGFVKGIFKIIGDVYLSGKKFSWNQYTFRHWAEIFAEITVAVFCIGLGKNLSSVQKSALKGGVIEFFTEMYQGTLDYSSFKSLWLQFKSCGIESGKAGFKAIMRELAKGFLKMVSLQSVIGFAVTGGLGAVVGSIIAAALLDIFVDYSFLSPSVEMPHKPIKQE